jgi:8-oxo-dGTP diphosphatase
MNTIYIASVAIINCKKELLLVRKKQSIFYQLVGGKIQPNETIEQTVIRETLEEVGFKIIEQDLVKMGTHKTKAVNEPNTQVEGHIFYLTLNGEALPIIANEIEDYVWMTPNNYKNYQWAHLAQEFVLPFWLKLIE